MTDVQTVKSAREAQPVRRDGGGGKRRRADAGPPPSGPGARRERGTLQDTAEASCRVAIGRCASKRRPLGGAERDEPSAKGFSEASNQCPGLDRSRSRSRVGL